MPEEVLGDELHTAGNASAIGSNEVDAKTGWQTWGDSLLSSTSDNSPTDGSYCIEAGLEGAVSIPPHGIFMDLASVCGISVGVRYKITFDVRHVAGEPVAIGVGDTKTGIDDYVDSSITSSSWLSKEYYLAYDGVTKYLIFQSDSDYVSGGWTGAIDNLSVKALVARGKLSARNSERAMRKVDDLPRTKYTRIKRAP